jgi:drug/metabolite transporter (DMT)-like permease
MSHHHAIVEFVRKRWPEALFIGAIGLGLTQGTIFTALTYTSAINAGIIFATTPIITMVLAHFVIHEQMNAWQAVGSAIAFLGIVMVAVHGSLDRLLDLQLRFGDLLVMAAAAMFACYTVLLKRAKFELERLPLLFVLLCAGAISTVPFFLWEIWNGEHADLAFKGYMVLLYAAVPGGALMYLCFNWSIDVLGPLRAGTLLYTQMIFTAVLAWLILGESIEWYHYVGAGLIIVGVLFVTMLRPQPAASTAK